MLLNPPVVDQRLVNGVPNVVLLVINALMSWLTIPVSDELAKLDNDDNDVVRVDPMLDTAPDAKVVRSVIPVPIVLPIPVKLLKTDTFPRSPKVVELNAFPKLVTPRITPCSAPGVVNKLPAKNVAAFTVDKVPEVVLVGT